MNGLARSAWCPPLVAALWTFLVVVCWATVADSQTGTVQFERSAVTIVTDRGRFRFDVELASSEEQRVQGLQHRRELPVASGMLFDFKLSRVVTMWMKDTLIPLDMLFIAGDGTVMTIAENTQPLSLAPISSRVPVTGVLEVNAGTVKRLGLRAGDRVVHPMFDG